MKGSNRASCLLLGLFITTSTTTACVTSPLNHSTLPTKVTQVTFQGYYLAPNGQITVLVLNNSTQAFDSVGTTQSNGSDPSTDKTGRVWYPWITKLTLPSDSQYWMQVGNQLTVKVKAETSTNYSLPTFDEGVEVFNGCWWQNAHDGGFAVINNCASPESPVVTLTTPCGGAGQSCCNNKSCSFGKLCSGDLCSISCGSSGKACCSGNACGSDMTCSAGLCQSCGGSGQPCCSSNTCKGPGLVCKSGSCSACGGLGQACCAGSVCGSGAKCSGGLCQACGGAGQPCCGGSLCFGGNSCQNGSCTTPAAQCEPWGNSCSSSQECCSGTSCLTTSSGNKECCQSLAADGSCN
jgi:hypothetical protein